MSNETEIKRQHGAEKMKDDTYLLSVKGEPVGVVSWDLARDVMLGRMSAADAIKAARAGGGAAK